MTYSKVRHISKETPSKLSISYTPVLFDRRSEQSILQYFERKGHTMRRSPYKIVVCNTFEKPLNKTSFLIYEYTRHRQICKKNKIVH
jgi:hypothetical protein